MKTHTSYLTFKTKKRQEIIDITDDVEACRAAAGISEGFVLVSAMHISASVFVNDHEPGLWKDILDWLENRIAPWSPEDYRHNTGTGEDNAAAHYWARSNSPGYRGSARFRTLAARFLWRVGRAALQARHSKSDGRLAVL